MGLGILTWCLTIHLELIIQLLSCDFALYKKEDEVQPGDLSESNSADSSYTYSNVLPTLSLVKLRSAAHARSSNVPTIQAAPKPNTAHNSLCFLLLAYMCMLCGVFCLVEYFSL